MNDSPNDIHLLGIFIRDRWIHQEPEELLGIHHGLLLGLNPKKSATFDGDIDAEGIQGFT